MGKKIYEWDGVNPADNNFVASDGGWPEGMLRSDVNNAARENLSDLRQWHDDMDWQKVTVRGPAVADVGSFSRTGDYSFTVTYTDGTTNIASHFDVGRILKFYNSGGVAVGAVTQVVSASYSGSGVTTVTTTSAVPKAINGAAAEVRAFFSREVRPIAFEAQQTDFFVPETADSAGIQAAISSAMAAGGGTVLLTAATYIIDTEIDMTSVTSYLTIKGANPEVVLYMDNGANLDALVHFSDGSQLASFENLRFNGNRANNPTGNSYGLEVTDNISLTVKDCQFVNLEEGIHFNSNNGTRIIIENCKFFGIQGFGIWTPQAGDHIGTITDCLFDGATLNVANPAMLKIAGRWNIDNNRFINCADNSITPRAIHLWNEITTEPGGRLSVVSNNAIISTNGSLAVGIEIGGDDVVISGNMLVMQTGTTGIYLNGSGAGTTNQKISVTGNTVRNGSSCCVVTERVRDAVLSGNVFSNSTNGIIVQGDYILVTGNHFDGGESAVVANSGANRCTISDNQMRNQTTQGVLLDTVSNAVVSGNVMHLPSAIGVNTANTVTSSRINANRIDLGTTGISLGASVSGMVVTNNDTIGCTTDISDSGTSTNRMWNSFDVHRETIRNTHSGALPGNLTAHSMPCGGKAGRYVSTITVQGHANSGTFAGTWTGYYGANGTSADTGLPPAYIDSRTSNQKFGTAVQFEFTAANTDTLFGLYWTNTGGSTDFDYSITIEKVGLE